MATLEEKKQKLIALVNKIDEVGEVQSGIYDYMDQLVAQDDVLKEIETAVAEMRRTSCTKISTWIHEFGSRHRENFEERNALVKAVSGGTQG